MVLDPTPLTIGAQLQEDPFAARGHGKIEHTERQTESLQKSFYGDIGGAVGSVTTKDPAAGNNGNLSSASTKGSEGSISRLNVIVPSRDQRPWLGCDNIVPGTIGDPSSSSTLHQPNEWTRSLTEMVALGQQQVRVAVQRGPSPAPLIWRPSAMGVTYRAD